MNVYLAGVTPEIIKQQTEPFFLLESFAYIKKHASSLNALLRNNLLLDSGAFTFIGDKKYNINWNEYVKHYCEFINKNNVELFLELDIYKIIGVEETEKLRKQIEDATQKKCIPVWHMFLGIEYFKKLCNEYEYIAIGASGKRETNWTRRQPEKLKALVKYANSKGVKVHGLGYTVFEQLKQIPFHSVDSTAWLNAGKFGQIHLFANNKIKKVEARLIQKKTIQSKADKMLLHNFNEWIKFQKYAQNNL